MTILRTLTKDGEPRPPLSSGLAAEHQAPLERYTPPVTLDDRFGAHQQVARLVGTDKEVLDLGCGGGFLAERLLRQGCRVTGVELDPESVERARTVCHKVIEGSVEEISTMQLAPVDVVVCADILEHTRNPKSILLAARNLLRPGGRIVISVPNIAYLSVRLKLLIGRFQYTESGILDETHLRFFTMRSIVELLVEAGYEIDEMSATPALPAGRMFPQSNRLRELSLRLSQSLPTLFACQFIVGAKAAEADLKAAV